MKTSLTIFFVIVSIACFAQKENSTRIIVKPQTSNLFEAARVALVQTNFIVKDEGKKDRLATYAREFDNMPGYAVASIEIDSANRSIIISGYYGLKKLNDWGYTSSPKNYKPIIYFKGSKGWKLLLEVANKIGGEISTL